MALVIVAGCSKKAAPIVPAAAVRPTKLVRCETQCGEPGSVQWLTQTPNALSAGGVAVHANGTVVTVGTFSGSASFGAVTLRSTSDDIFLAKYDREGAPIWARRLGGPNADSASRVAVAENGDTLVAGSFVEEASFESARAKPIRVTSVKGQRAGFVARYDVNGEARWVTTLAADELPGLAVARDGSAVATGSFHGIARFSEQVELRAAGDEDAFVVRFDQRGAIAWARSAGGAERDSANAVAMLPDGSAVVTGQFLAEASFGHGHSLRSTAASDGFVAIYDALGTLRSLHQLPGQGVDYGSGVATSTDGTLYVTGASASPEEPGTRVGSPDRYDMFVAKLDAESFSWRERLLRGGAGDRGRDIAASVDRIVVSGEFSKTLVFGDRMIYATRGRDLYFACFSSDRAPLWAVRAGPVKHSAQSGVALQADGAVVIVGTVGADATLGQRSLEAGYFLAKLAP